MSLASWKQTYYPVAAKEATASVVRALDHSLSKWIGLQPGCLIAHSVRKVYEQLRGEEGEEPFAVNSGTCALCLMHQDDKSCSHCPLLWERGARCDAVLADEHRAPYGAWVFGSDPRPMVSLIRSAYKHFGAEPLSHG